MLLLQELGSEPKKDDMFYVNGEVCLVDIKNTMTDFGSTHLWMLHPCYFTVLLFPNTNLLNI